MNYTLGRPFSALQACFVTRCHSGCRGGKRRQVVSVWYAINHFFRDRPILTYIQRYIHRVSTLQAGWYFGFAKKKYLLHTKRAQIVGATANVNLSRGGGQNMPATLKMADLEYNSHCMPLE